MGAIKVIHMTFGTASAGSLNPLTTLPESTHFCPPCKLTQNGFSPRGASPKSPQRLTLVPESTHLIGRKPASVLDLTALNLYLMYPRMFSKRLSMVAGLFLNQSAAIPAVQDGEGSRNNELNFCQAGLLSNMRKKMPRRNNRHVRPCPNCMFL